jgi:phosphoadenosine phosphosulfate reductase
MEERAAADLSSRVSAVRKLLAEALARHQRLTYASSLGFEAIVLIDLIAANAPAIDIFTIDTGRLHEETYELLARLQSRYANRIRVIYPAATALERLVSRQGVNGFYESIEARLECCRVRKVEPFKRAVAGFTAWITGIRRRHSADRASGEAFEWDREHGLYKVSPLLEWSDEDLWHYIRARQLPYNRLHDRGFPSIGCAPCTRAVEAGEDFRAGRWWWEQSAVRECGLVQKPRSAATIGATQNL